MRKFEHIKYMAITMGIALSCCAAVFLASCVTGPVPVTSHHLAKDGKVTSCIVLADNAGPVEKHAAAELAAYLEKITGAKVETVAAPSNEKYNIYIGTLKSKNLPLTWKMKSNAKKLGEDGYMLAADGGGLRVVGQNSRGVLYGVYGLLKKYGNVRWFFPGPEGEYCPRSPNFLVSSGVTISNPSFQYRMLNLFCASSNHKITNTWDWMVRNGMQIACRREPSKAKRKELDREREKRGDETMAGGHSFSYLISDNLFDAHPEYFALIDGKRTPQGASTGDGTEKQPCTSNPNVVEIMTEKLLEWGEIPPRGGSFLIGNNDSQFWCQCEKCVKLDPPEEREKHFVSTRYWTLLNAMADKALAKNPELKLRGWAYQNFQEPPVGIVPDKRFSVQICLHQRCYRHRMDDENCASNKRFRDMLVNWVKLNPVSTYEYTDCLPGGDVIYLPLEHVFAHDLKYYHRIGVRGPTAGTVPPDGVFGSSYEGNRRVKETWLANWQFVYMTAYFLWDVDADCTAVYEDMGSKFYGVAWPAMKQYRAKLTTAWEETPGDAIYGTPDIALGKCLERPALEADLLKLLDDAEKTAAGDEALLKKIRREREYFALSWQKMHKEYVAKSKLFEVGASRCVEKIAIDGKLDEKEWGKADFTTGFISQKGDKADPQTFVRILYDKDNIYFGVESLESELSRMKVVCDKKDGEVWRDNDIEIFLVAPANAVKYLHLVVNSAGVVYDSMTTGTGFTDIGFDSGAEVKTATLPGRWVLEARIPTSALGSSTRDGEVWKVNVARHRVLTDGAPQGSSLCGSFHSVDFFRSIAFGGKGLIQNGDFEDAEKRTEAQRKETKWVFKTDSAPSQWNFHQLAGEAELIEGGAASGRKFLRVKSFANTNGQASIACIVQYRLAIKEADTLLVRAKVRGKGEFTAYGWRYNFDTGRPETNFSSLIGATLKIDSTEWTPFEGVYNYDGKTFLALAFYFVSLQGIDIDDVTITRWENTR